MKYVIFPRVQDRGLHKRQPLLGQKVTREPAGFSLESHAPSNASRLQPCTQTNGKTEHYPQVPVSPSNEAVTAEELLTLHLPLVQSKATVTVSARRGYSS